MANLYRVAIHYENDNGYIEYDANDKKIKVELANEGKRHEIEEYLGQKHTIHVPQNTLRDFNDVTVVPADNVDNLKLVLTRMWERIGVFVDWSRPCNVM